MKGLHAEGRKTEERLVITVERRGRREAAESLDAGVLRDIEVFFHSLGGELKFLRTRPVDIGRAEVLLLARLNGILAGMIGIVRRFCGVPCTFVVVRKNFQHRGIARALYEAQRPHCGHYGAVFSIVLAGNLVGREFFRGVGEELLADDGRYIVFVASPKRFVRRLYPLARRLLSPLLKLGQMLARHSATEG